MRKQLKSLIDRLRTDDSRLGDLAAGDWSPIPQNKGPLGGWSSWLDDKTPVTAQPPQMAPLQEISPSPPVASAPLKQVPTYSGVRPTARAQPAPRAAPAAPRKEAATLRMLTAPPPVVSTPSSAATPKAGAAAAPAPPSAPDSGAVLRLLQHLSPIERVLVEQQRGGNLLQRLTPVRGSAAIGAPSAARPAAASSATTGSASAPPQAQAATPRWIEILRSYGEYLTDEEILAMRSQLVG